LQDEEYPIGHPEVLEFNRSEAEQAEAFKRVEKRDVFGFVRAFVIPPAENLYHPLLPMRANKWTLFALCKICAEDGVSRSCPHTDLERGWTAVIPTPELWKALDLGYRLSYITSIWHFPKTKKYNGTDPESGLFNHYVQTFLKVG